MTLFDYYSLHCSKYIFRPEWRLCIWKNEYWHQGNVGFICVCLNCVRMCVDSSTRVSGCVRVSMYALVCELWGEIPLSGLGVLPVVELCLYSLALSGYPTLPMSVREREGERWTEGWRREKRGTNRGGREEGIESKGSGWGTKVDKWEKWKRQWQEFEGWKTRLTF